MSDHECQWKNEGLTDRFLTGVRARIPLANEQIDVMRFVLSRARQDVSNFIDIGCGDGILSRVIQNQYPNAYGTLLDFSEPMLEHARANFTDEQARIFYQDLNESSWIDRVRDKAPYDVVVSGYAIHHLTDVRKQSLYAEIYDLLAPKGIFINIEHVSVPDQWNEDLFTHAFAQNLYPLRKQEEPDLTYEQMIERLDQEDGDICAPADTQCDWLREIGFVHVDVYMKIYALAVFGGVRGCCCVMQCTIPPA